MGSRDEHRLQYDSHRFDSLTSKISFFGGLTSNTLSFPIGELIKGNITAQILWIYAVITKN